MASTTHAATAPVDPPSSAAIPSADELTAKTVLKRYDGLVTVRTKAVKGKGAWYWAHLEPTLVRNPDTGLAKAVKLRCSLCDATFSASNPSRTASEHLKRGTCPNFSSVPTAISVTSSIVVPTPTPVSSTPMVLPSPQNHRKRSGGVGVGVPSGFHQSSSALALVDPARQYSSEFSPYTPNSYTRAHAHAHLLLSGGKDDLGALAMLEDSVKRLKSPKTSPGPILGRAQIDSALSLLSDWIYEACGAVSLSSVEHPKFKAFLNQVGLPAVSRRELASSRLEARYEELRRESEARVRDAMYFQISSDGWKSKNYGLVGGERLVCLAANLPNGTSVFQKAVFISGPVPSKYAEDILWEAIMAISGSAVQRCVGIVSDKFKSKALRDLENQNHWMVNLVCQLQGFTSLIKDFNKELQIFQVVGRNCLRVANFFNGNHRVWSSLHRYQLQVLDHTELIRVPPVDYERTNNYLAVCAMLDDIWASARPLQLVVMDESYKEVCIEDQNASEIAEMINNMGFWSELEAVHCLVKLVKEMVQEIEVEKPLIGQCLPLWEELRGKVKEWCTKFNIAEGVVENVVEKRFRKNYHPAWSAAFILDPLYLMRDTSGKYLPPFKYLTPEQEKDVDRLITRLVSREEAHIVLMELMKWRSEGLDPLYAQAVQVKQRDPVTGKMKLANPQSSRLVWQTCLSELKLLGQVAVRLIFLNATSSCGFKCNWSFLRWLGTHRRSRIGTDRAQKLIFIAAHAKLERRDFCSEEDKDAELFGVSSGEEEDALNRVFAADPSPV